MYQNVVNYGVYMVSDRESPLSSFISSNTIWEKPGCNQVIRSLDEQRLFIFIPNIFIDEVCNKLNRSLEEIINEFKILGFKYRIHKSSSNRKYRFFDDNNYCIKDSTIFELNLDDYHNPDISTDFYHKIKYRYYGFCMIRHFYYFQNVLLNYYKLYNENDPVAIKIIKLSASVHASSNSYAMHSFLNSKVNNIYLDLNHVFRKFILENNNSIPFSVNLETMDYDENSVEYVYEKYIEAFNTRTILNSNFIIVSENTLNILPGEFKKEVETGYEIFNVEYDNNKNQYVTYYFINNPTDRFLKYLTKVDNRYVYSFSINNSINIRDLNTPKSMYSILLEDRIYYTASVFKDKIFTFNVSLYNEDNSIVEPPKKLHYVRIKSRHPSHNVFRKSILSDKKVLIRLGSTTDSNSSYDLIINSIPSIGNSSNKRRMKTLFNDYNVITAEWTNDPNTLIESENNFPVIAKHVNGSRGTGNYKLDTPEELNNFISRRNISNYIFEKFKNYSKEYRVHVSTEGVFLMWRKLRRLDTPQNQRWFFNNQNCNWVGEDHELFDAPRNIEEIKSECLRALNAVGLDIGACDVRVTSNDRKNVLYSIIEINSAPSMAERTSEAYTNEFIKLINKR